MAFIHRTNHFRGSILIRGRWSSISCSSASISICMLLTISMHHEMYCSPVPTNNTTNISVIRDERILENISSGDYSYLIQFSDGTKLEQRGNLNRAIPVGGINVTDETNANPDNVNDMKHENQPVVGLNNGLSVSGSYTFTDPVSGIKHEVKYVADKSGYHPHYISTSGSKKTSMDRSTENSSELANAEINDSTQLPPLKTISASLFSSQSETL